MLTVKLSRKRSKHNPSQAKKISIDNFLINYLRKKDSKRDDSIFVVTERKKDYIFLMKGEHVQFVVYI